MSNKYDRHYPAIPLRNVTVFPGMVMHFDVSRKKSVKAVEASMAADELIYLVTQRDSQVSEPGIADKTDNKDARQNFKGSGRGA